MNKNIGRMLYKNDECMVVLSYNVVIGSYQCREFNYASGGLFDDKKLDNWKRNYGYMEVKYV